MDKPERYKDLLPEQRDREAWLRSTIWSYERLIGKYIDGEDQIDCFGRCPLCEMFRNYKVAPNQCTACPNATDETWNCINGSPNALVKALIRGDGRIKECRIDYLKQQLPLLKAELLNLYTKRKQCAPGKLGTPDTPSTPPTQAPFLHERRWCLITNNSSLNSRAEGWREVIVEEVGEFTITVRFPARG